MIQLPDMPPRIAALPRDHRGYPVPWFVAWVDGKPVFPCADSAKLVRAVRERRCWVCGDLLARNLAFVVGPMCTVNRTSAEPPCHLECAVFSAMACPFLAKPKMKRQDVSDIATLEPPGNMLKRNPGVACVWSTRSFDLMHVPNGVLFRIGEPMAVRWFCEGRDATRDEVLESMDSGLPLLANVAKEEGPEAEAELNRMHCAALAYLPDADAAADAAFLKAVEATLAR